MAARVHGVILEGRRPLVWRSGVPMRNRPAARRRAPRAPCRSRRSGHTRRPGQGLALQRRIAQALTVPGVDRRGQRRREDHRAEGHAGRAGEEVPVDTRADLGDLLRFYRNLKLQKEYTVAVGALGFDTWRGSTTSRTRRWNPAKVLNSDFWGGVARGHRRAWRVPENPLKARWLGIYDFGADPRTSGRLAQVRRPARLHPDGDPGRDRALRPGPGRRADLHRVASKQPARPGARGMVSTARPDLPDWHLLPAALFGRSQRLVWPNAERDDTLQPRSQHRVPHGTRRWGPGSDATVAPAILPTSCASSAS